MCVSVSVCVYLCTFVMCQVFVLNALIASTSVSSCAYISIMQFLSNFLDIAYASITYVIKSIVIIIITRRPK